jgi:hypothetical protein
LRVTAGKLIFEGGMHVDIEQYCDPDKTAILSLNADAFLMYMCPNDQVDNFTLIRFDISRNRTMQGKILNPYYKSKNKPLCRGDEPVQ